MPTLWYYFLYAVGKRVTGGTGHHPMLGHLVPEWIVRYRILVTRVMFQCPFHCNSVCRKKKRKIGKWLLTRVIRRPVNGFEIGS